MIPFVKMAGCGNDFVLVEAADLPVGTDASVLGRAVCTPGTGLGADGLVVMRPGRTGNADFAVTIINRSGLPAEMCGNAARCIARRAVDRGFAAAQHAFLTEAGIVAARVSGRQVTLDLPDPSPLVLDRPIIIAGETWVLDVIHVGVPHAVLWWEDIDNAPVSTLGLALRHSPAFPDGANINFAALRPDGRIRVRTFERGVEAETLACGTGSTAVAIAAATRGRASAPVKIVTTQGGVLTIGFALAPEGARHVTLAGPTTYVAEGHLADEWLAEALTA